MSGYKIGEKVVVYAEGVVEKIEQESSGTRLTIRYPNPDKAGGNGLAWVDADIVERASAVSEGAA